MVRIVFCVEEHDEGADCDLYGRAKVGIPQYVYYGRTYSPFADHGVQHSASSLPSLRACPSLESSSLSRTGLGRPCGLLVSKLLPCSAHIKVTILAVDLEKRQHFIAEKRGIGYPQKSQ